MKIPRAAFLAAFLLPIASVSQAQSVPGVPMRAKIVLEQSLDGRRFYTVSETAYFRDSLGRVRVDEVRFDANGVPIARTNRLARIEAGILVVYSTEAGSNRAVRLELPGAQLTLPPPQPHQHPDDGTRFSNRCVTGIQRYSNLFPRIEIVACEKIGPGPNITFQKDGMRWRESFEEAQGGEQHFSLFEVTSGQQVFFDPERRTPNGALRKFYELQPPPREPLLLPSPPTPFTPELQNPTFVPGQQCDEFRLAGKELVTWNCKDKESPLHCARTRRVT